MLDPDRKLLEDKIASCHIEAYCIRTTPMPVWASSSKEPKAARVDAERAQWERILEIYDLGVANSSENAGEDEVLTEALIAERNGE